MEQKCVVGELEAFFSLEALLPQGDLELRPDQRQGQLVVALRATDARVHFHGQGRQVGDTHDSGHLPLPLLTYRLLPSYLESRPALRVPFFAELAALTGRKPAPGAAVLRKSFVQLALIGVAWALIVASAARPQLRGAPVVEIETARDLLIAVDLSGSMDTPDFVGADGGQVERLQAVKEVLRAFVERRQGDRLGLVVFGSSPFLQAP